jgi:ribose 5-phosphate isomerase A
VDAELNLIKGGGGAHTREKIVNFASKKNVIIVDDEKLSRHLGEKWPVPVEVLRFGHLSTARALSRIGRAVHRIREGGPVITDTGSFVYDVFTGPISDPAALDMRCGTFPASPRPDYSSGVRMSSSSPARADCSVSRGPEAQAVDRR